MQQTGTVAVGSKWLGFHLWWATSVLVPPDPNEVFNVLIDGTTIFSLTQETAATYVTGCAQVSVDISAYADGNAHTLRFEASSAPSSEGSAVFVDDVGIRMLTDAVFLDGFEPQ